MRSALERLQKLATGTLESAWFFEFQQALTVGPIDSLHRAIRREVADQPPDTLLDVCSGIGGFADVCDAQYLGVDISPVYVARAQERFAGDPRRRFVLHDALLYPFEEGAFHTALYVNALHHFDDAGALELLRILRRTTRHRLIVADPAPETLFPPARLLIALDRCPYIRPAAGQIALIEQAGFQVLRHYTLYRGFSHARVLVCR